MISRVLIARAFGRAAPHYDLHADLQRQVADQLLNLIEPEFTAKDMIDLGCGTGYCSVKLREQFPDSQLLVLDMAMPMLQTTRQHRIENCMLVCADVQAIPLRDAQFDLMVSNLTIQWCARTEALFTELFRIARPGAKILLSTFGPSTLHEIKTAWARVDDYVHVNEFAPLADLLSKAEAAGFGVDGKAVLVERRYTSLQAVGKELKGLGAYNMNSQQAQGFTSRKALAAAEQAFSEQRTAEGVPVTFEIFYLQLTKPGLMSGGKQ
ncbi:MAG: malonyl-ACP O-methyltransferase BioC [Pseudomonadota bacterium]